MTARNHVRNVSAEEEKKDANTPMLFGGGGRGKRGKVMMGRKRMGIYIYGFMGKASIIRSNRGDRDREHDHDPDHEMGMGDRGGQME